MQEDEGEGHLGEKEQPIISLIKLGGSPSNDCSFFFSPRIEGVESKSAFVYECLGDSNTACVGPISTIEPAYITAILSVISAITAMS